MTCLKDDVNSFLYKIRKLLNVRIRHYHSHALLGSGIKEVSAERKDAVDGDI